MRSVPSNPMPCALHLAAISLAAIGFVPLAQAQAVAMTP